MSGMGLKLMVILPVALVFGGMITFLALRSKRERRERHLRGEVE